MPFRCVCVRDFSLTTKHPLMRCLMQAWHTHACLFSIVCLRPTNAPIGQPFKGQWLMFFESVQRSSNRACGFASRHFAPFATLIVLVSLLHLLRICVKTEWLVVIHYFLVLRNESMFYRIVVNCDCIHNMLLAIQITRRWLCFWQICLFADLEICARLKSSKTISYSIRVLRSIIRIAYVV